MACLAAAAAAVLLASGVLAEPSQYIYPGLTTHTPHWNDTDGNRIEAHAAGMFQVSSLVRLSNTDIRAACVGYSCVAGGSKRVCGCGNVAGLVGM